MAVEMKSWSELATFYHQVVLIFNGIFGFAKVIVFVIVVLQCCEYDHDSTYTGDQDIDGDPDKRPRLADVPVRGDDHRFLGGVLGLLFGTVGQLINWPRFSCATSRLHGYPLQIMLEIVDPGQCLSAKLGDATYRRLPGLRASRLRIVDALGTFECGLRSAECGVRNGECGMGNSKMKASHFS
jgi:putative ABC transport system permease protein